MTPVEKLFAQTHILPTIPKVVSELIASLNNPDVEIEPLADKVRLDQVLTAKVLRLANSAHYGVSRKIGTINDAIVLIGLNQLRTLVIACGMAGAFTKVPGVDLTRFWRHSLLTGFIARALAKEAKLNGEMAFTAGLMHGIGILLIHLGFPDAAPELAKQTKGMAPSERPSIEKALVGLDHCEVGAELARRWNFPDEIATTIRFYPDPTSHDAGPYSTEVYVASFIASALENHRDPKLAAEAIPPSVTEKIDLEAASLDDRIDRYKAMEKDATMLF